MTDDISQLCMDIKCHFFLIFRFRFFRALHFLHDFLFKRLGVCLFQDNLYIRIIRCGTAVDINLNLAGSHDHFEKILLHIDIGNAGNPYGIFLPVHRISLDHNGIFFDGNISSCPDQKPVNRHNDKNSSDTKKDKNSIVRYNHQVIPGKVIGVLKKIYRKKYDHSKQAAENLLCYNGNVIPEFFILFHRHPSVLLRFH